MIYNGEGDREGERKRREERKKLQTQWGKSSFLGDAGKIGSKLHFSGSGNLQSPLVSASSLATALLLLPVPCRLLLPRLLPPAPLQQFQSPSKEKEVKKAREGRRYLHTCTHAKGGLSHTFEGLWSGRQRQHIPGSPRLFVPVLLDLNSFLSPVRPDSGAAHSATSVKRSATSSLCKHQGSFLEAAVGCALPPSPCDRRP